MVKGNPHNELQCTTHSWFYMSICVYDYTLCPLVLFAMCNNPLCAEANIVYDDDVTNKYCNMPVFPMSTYITYNLQASSF